MTLSARAAAWLEKLGVTQRRPRLDKAAMRGYLKKHSLPAWPALLAVEANYGGLATSKGANRELAFGVDKWFGRRREIDKRPHLLVAFYDPILWFMDKGGRIVEIDDLGERFYESDSIAHRIEQTVLFEDSFKHAQSLPGFHGSAIANAISLPRIDEACDSRQQIWANANLMVRESLEPSDYGKRDLVELTWISTDTDAMLRQAIGLTR